MNTDLSDTLLLVDDDNVFRTRLAKAFRDRGYEVVEASGLTEGRQAIKESQFVYGVFDLALGDGDGLQLLQLSREVHPEMRVVILTGYGTIGTTVQAMQQGACHYLTKPTNADVILDVLSGKPGVASTRRTDPTDQVPTLSQVEWDHMHRVLDECKGNITHAAQLLGLHRRSLQRKLAKMPGRLR